MQLASDAVAALQAAGFVGTWDTDVPAGRSVLDAGAATLLAGNPSLAGQPPSLPPAPRRVHPARYSQPVQHQHGRRTDQPDRVPPAHRVGTDSSPE